MKDYIDYLKDNPKGYWFKRKVYGWGWVPVTWEGVLVLIAAISLIYAGFATFIKINPGASVRILVLTLAALMAVCYLKGEKPKWQWGLKKKSH